MKFAADICGMDCQTLRDRVQRYNAEGIDGLCNRGGGVKPLLSEGQMAQLSRWVEAGPDPARSGTVRREKVSCVGVAWVLPGALRRRSKSFASIATDFLPEAARSKPLEVWFQYDARVGQQGALTRIWAQRGSRPHAPRDTRSKWCYSVSSLT